MIHATSIVHENARLGREVTIGPGAVIGAEVELGDRCSVGAHTVIEGQTRIGADCQIGHHVVLGSPPQDKAYRGEATRLEVGERTVIREFVSINRGSPKDKGLTRVGSDVYLMAYAHVAHDCTVGDHVVMANAATLAGHVSVGDRVNIGGLVAIHQFARVGEYAMVGGGAITTQDIPPYAVVSGNHARWYGINRRGLQRGGFDGDVIKQIRRAYRVLFQSGLRLQEAVTAIDEDESLRSPQVRHLVEFVRDSKRGVVR
jgi:UDP-N-acetylglucosamine acyltransferase